MEALSAQLPVCFEIVTTVPQWFFEQSLTAPFTLHSLPSDIGLIQHNALEIDLGRTIQALDGFYPLRKDLVAQAAELFAGCTAVLCDIAPLGIAAARRAGTPSVLLENFTWDWIYQPYCRKHPGFSTHIETLQQLYAQADYHLQANPVCHRLACDLHVAPVARRRREPGSRLRRQLQIGDTETAVLVTMGGIAGTPLPLDEMSELEQCFIVPGASGDEVEIRGNLRLLPLNSSLYHPDLVAACDAVVGKVGYSTLAEIYQAGIPWGWIGRPGFRESSPLAAFIRQEMASIEITEQEFGIHDWLGKVTQLCSLRSDGAGRRNGADEAAAFLHDLLRAQ